MPPPCIPSWGTDRGTTRAQMPEDSAGPCRWGEEVRTQPDAQLGVSSHPTHRGPAPAASLCGQPMGLGPDSRRSPLPRWPPGHLALGGGGAPRLRVWDRELCRPHPKAVLRLPGPLRSLLTSLGLTMSCPRVSQSIQPSRWSESPLNPSGGPCALSAGASALGCRSVGAPGSQTSRLRAAGLGLPS